MYNMYVQYMYDDLISNNLSIYCNSILKYYIGCYLIAVINTGM